MSVVTESYKPLPLDVQSLVETLPSLPEELFEAIIMQLERAALLTASQVNRTWRRTALTLFMKRELEKIDAFLTRLTRSPHCPESLKGFRRGTSPDSIDLSAFRAYVLGLREEIVEKMNFPPESLARDLMAGPIPFGFEGILENARIHSCLLKISQIDRNEQLYFPQTLICLGDAVRARKAIESISDKSQKKIQFQALFSKLLAQSRFSEAVEIVNKTNPHVSYADLAKTLVERRYFREIDQLVKTDLLDKNFFLPMTFYQLMAIENFDEALRVSEKIQDGSDRVRAVASLYLALMRSRRHDEASAILDSLPPSMRDHLFAHLSKMINDHERALELAHRIRSDSLRKDALSSILKVLLDQKKWNPALELATELQDHRALDRIHWALSKQLVQNDLGAALEHAQMVSNLDLYADALEGICARLLDLGEWNRAASFATFLHAYPGQASGAFWLICQKLIKEDAFETITRMLDEKRLQAESYILWVVGPLESREERAIRLMQTNSPHEIKEEVIYLLFEQLVARGKLERASELIGCLSEENCKFNVCSIVGAGFMKQKNHPALLQLSEKIKDKEKRETFLAMFCSATATD